MKKNFLPINLFLTVALSLASCDSDLFSYFQEEEDSYDVDYDVETVEEALDKNCITHELSEDYTWSESDAVSIVLDSTSISTTSQSVLVGGTTVTIQSAGIYSISGTLTDGSIIVSAGEDETVYIVFNGVDITNSSSAPFFISSAEKTIIKLADNTENFLTDTKNYVFASEEEDEPNGTLFSKDNLTIFGNGSLTIDANYNDGIVSKDGLVINSGTISINAVDDGIRGKDYLVINDGDITITAKGDGLKSDNEDESKKGWILMNDGTVNVTATCDGFQAKTDLLFTGGTVNVTTGGGSSKSVASTATAKGLKSTSSIIIEDVEATLNCADDAVHANAYITVNGGTFTVKSGDDGFHSDSVLAINGGDITVSKSYEALESAVIHITDGNMYLKSSDDGINIAGGTDNSGGWGRPMETTSDDYYLKISGGFIYVNATGDCLDANGAIIIKGGTTVVNGPTSNGNGALDYDVYCKVNGGTLIAVGSSGMAQSASTSSSQYSVYGTFRSSKSAGTIFHIEDNDGNEVITFASAKNYASVVFSSPDLSKGSTYKVYYGGSSNGTNHNGLYEDGTYTPGTQSGSFTISNKVTRI